jgi:rhodanese-related sulfurtransferase
MKRLLLVLLVSLVVLTGGCQKVPNITVDTTPKIAPTLVDINPKEAFDLIQSNKNNPDFIIIDVRTPDEFAQGHIEKAINIEYKAETFQDEISKLDKNKTYLIYCKIGVRSASARNIMKELGFSEVYHMPGGIEKWQAEGLQITK